MKEFFLVLSSYLIGSISFAYTIGLVFKGIDIRTVGDKNAGAANAFRHLGPVLGVVVAILDICKGISVILIVKFFNVKLPVIFLCGIAVVIGHTWPVYFGFKGGRGVSCAIGIFFALFPIPTLVLMAIMALIIYTTGSINIAITTLFVSILIFAVLVEKSFMLFLYVLSISLLLLIIDLITVRKLSSEEKEESLHVHIRIRR